MGIFLNYVVFPNSNQITEYKNIKKFTDLKLKNSFFEY